METEFQFSPNVVYDSKTHQKESSRRPQRLALGWEGLDLRIEHSKLQEEGKEIEKENLRVQKETFLFNTNLELINQNSEIEKYQQLLFTDQEIIEMYSSIKNTSLFKLENGTIDVNDYLRDVNQESIAIQNKLLHEIKLLMIIEEQKLTQGI